MKAINLDTAVFTTFLTQGATAAGIDVDPYGGHIGLVEALAEHARAISKVLRSLPYPDDGYPGVLAYEIIEPIGAWLAEDGTRMGYPQNTALEFERRYFEWVNK